MATVSVTFDNLGEAADLERGTWPEDQALGEHFSVRECLPQLLGVLAAEDLRATFFVEGLNGELYPDALAGLAAAGHEVACHGWRHEPWAEVEGERELLARAREALGGPVGFRPPGGRMGAETPALLGELGFGYCSPAGERAGRLGGLAVLPFRWRLIDAYFYLPHFGPLRRINGDPEEAIEPAALRDRVLSALDEHAAGDGHLALLFHPFLLTAGPDALAVVSEVLARVRELCADGSLRCLRMDEAAAELPADAGPPELDPTSWE
ncbi:MAG TPA: polysaccharide deacetylase family protein [Solirubrobacteraceae bacterium]|nr:polysaccharide deacetylase family protein [Solirubrobacteraceae bacterium]